MLILQSIDKLQKINPAILFFSHGGATRQVNEIIQRVANDEQQCADISLKAMKASENREEMAISLASSPYFKSLMVGGYRQYFKKKNMI